jgi:glucosamine--fructose-6-phosphate aminotransferase (isomerizing)
MMYSEAAEAPSVSRLQIENNRLLLSQAVSKIRKFNPRLVLTCGRGSSSHAANYAKYLIETRIGIPTFLQAPSIASIYAATPENMSDTALIIMSQSGQSPDLLATASAVKASGGLLIGMVNDTTSPLAELVDILLPLHAGPEKSVAATKSYIATLIAVASLVAEWGQFFDLTENLAHIHEYLEEAWTLDWSQAVPTFAGASSMFTLGRGLTLAVAGEAALKLKETSSLHAESFSSAEVAHGPMAIIKRDFPIFAFIPNDQAAAGMRTIIDSFDKRGANIWVTGQDWLDGRTLPRVKDLHAAIAPICSALSFYKLCNEIALARGCNPDAPESLSKVTETL